ncbi:MAG: alpha-2-macroglobulin [Burkholderiales bacterium]|nr:alpha-2-macroglobulin [Burkholderiales bacterium]
MRTRDIAVLCIGLTLGFAAHAATIVAASPQGEVAQVRQVTVKFSEAVVAFGDPRLADPFAIACQGATPAGAGRWASDRVWLYDFREALPPGTKCTAKLRADWKPSAAASGAAAAAALTGPGEFSFSTGGPAIVAMQPGEGAEVEEDQHFLIRLNGPAVEASVLANAWCEVEGLGERLPLRLIGGDLRAQLLKARRIPPAQWPRLLIARCDRPLPNAAAVRLVWGKGIAAAANPKVVTTIEQRFRMRVRPAFTAEFSCEREKAAAPCLPIRPMSVRFSAPVPRELAAQVRLQPSSGEALAPVFDKDDKATELTELAFPKPLAENAAYSIAMPRELKDNAGRPLANAASFPLKVATGAAPPIAKFAAAPFGVIERNADGVLPVTLRHVQAELRGGAAAASAPAAASAGQVRVKRLQSDADILAWYAKLQKYHETQMTAEELGLPKSQWFTTEDDTDAKGRPIKRKVERRVGTREVSLLAKETDAKRLDLPQLAGGDPRPFEVVGLPLEGPGYHVVEIESLRLGQALLDKRAPMYVRTGVLVTNLGVHFKLGRENSVVWVTTLDRGKPVEGAEIAVNDCFGKPLWSGRSDAKGLAVVARALDASFENCPADNGFFVTARKADEKGGATDVAFVFSSWQKGIESWRFNVPTGRGAEPDLRAATVFDRTLLRAGETVSMKHFVRTETAAGLAMVPAAKLPTTVKLVHQGSGQEFVFPLQWSGGGRSATTVWNIPPAAKLGVYEVSLERPNGDAKPRREGDGEGEGEERQRTWSSGNFRVEEFRLPLVDARLSGPKSVAVAPASVAVDVQMSYFSGGPMSGAALRASALLKSHSPSFAGYDDFSFEPPRDPKKAEQEGSENDEGDGAARDGKLVADKLPLLIDRNGAASFTLKDLPKVVRPSQIDAEVSFADPNGETQTVATRVDLWPSAVVLGVRAGSWASNRGSAKFTVLALDTAGKPIKGQSVAVKGRVSQIISTRKRMVGGFYAYDNRTEVKELGSLCSGTTDDRGLLLCEATLETAGQVELVAESKDGAGNPVAAAATVWITKQGELWFAQDNDDRIDVLPEKKRYEPGETARLQVRMPFREATALVAVEREGVIATQVVTLRGDDPTVELKVEPAWGPNVYVSVLALRGRIRETPWYSFFTWGWKEPLDWWRSFRGDGKDWQAPTAMIDLAKPAFKLGVAKLQVGLAAHELQVSVTADKPQYAVRQTAMAKIKVTQGGKPMAGAHVAFAAVDEGLLALRGNDSWNLLEAMIRERAWGVETSTAQSEIIGRRHYGRKAVAAGGGGGRGSARELFDTLLIWKASIVVDANGEATVAVPINDSLTSFKLVAVADAEVQKFGTGSTSIRVTQDLQVLAGLPPLVRDGDQFSAMLTLRNTTAREMKVRATLQGTANLPATGNSSEIVRVPIALAPQDVVLAAGAAKEVVWPVSVPAEAFSIAWEAAAEEGSAKDRLKVTQLVAAAVPVRVLQATLAQLDGSFSLPVAAPADALLVGTPPASGSAATAAKVRGGLVVAVQPKLSGALPGMRRFFETYPFACLEQKTSKAVGLKDAKLWEGVANTLPTYLDSDGLASYFPPRAGEAPSGSDRLTAYVLAATHEAGFALPAPARDAMLAGLAGFVEGRIERKTWSPRPDLDVRKLAAIEALSRFGKAQAKTLGSINLTPNVWPTAAVIDWLNILKRVDGIPERAKRLEEANQILRGRLTYGGTTLKFSTEESDFWWWLMDSADANAARLILAVLDDPAWKDELPKMVVGSLARQRRGAWLTTTANLWGSLALDKFAAKFESQKVAGTTTATIEPPAPGAAASATRVADWSAQAAGGKATLAWPPGPGPGTLVVAQQGSGKPWLTVQSLAAIPLKAPFAAGYSIARSVTAVEQKDKSRWSRGDVVRVRLEIDAQADMTWVVVSDPVPGGATIFGSGLGRDSAIATRTEKRAGSAWPAHEERSFEAFRSYYEYLPRGKHVVEYSVRLNNPGRFALPPTRVEAMYAPESFGEAPNGVVEVGP